MRNIFKFLMMGLMMIALAGTATETFAQADPAAQQALYQKFLDNRKGPEIEKIKVAIAAGDEYIQKYGADEANKDIVAYINKLLPPLKKYVDQTQAAGQFDKDVAAKNWGAAFTSGKQFLAQNPDNIDVMLVLASIGFDNAVANPPVDTYNADALNFARTAIQKIEEGKPSPSGNYGALSYQYKNNDFADGKANALGWMNYTIGYIMFNRMNQKKEALPYLYKATQANSATRGFPEIYRLIGSYYRDEFNRIVTDRNAKIQANGGKETDESRNELGMQYAYAERAINAYANAYRAATPKETEAYKKPLMDTAKQFYEARFGKTDGADAYIAAEAGKPLPDPTAAVTPVAVEALDTPATPATGTPTTTTSPATTTTPATTAPATTTRPATTTTTPKPATTTTTTAPKTTPSASPAPKKPRK